MYIDRLLEDEPDRGKGAVIFKRVAHATMRIGGAGKAVPLGVVRV
jgi:hypothetical protein